MQTFPVPANLNGASLRVELDAIGIDGEFFIRNNELHVDSDDVRVTDIVTAHTGEPTLEQRQEKEERDQIAALRTKALAVWRGQDNFTAAQVQKILAGIVLRLSK